MVATEDEFADLLYHVDLLLTDRRGHRFTVYIEPKLADAAIGLVEGGWFESRSIVLDTALRRQLLHELQLDPAHGFFLDELDCLAELLALRIPRPKNLSGAARPVKRGPTANERGQKVRISSRTNEGVHLLAEMVVDDPRLSYTSMSEFVESGLRRIEFGV